MPPRLEPLRLLRHTRRLPCRLYSSSRSIREHDVVILRQRGNKDPKFHLSPPLRPDAPIKLAYGAKVNASEIIGKSFTDLIHDSDGRDVRLTEASLAQYIANSPRVATPIYPQDANLIVSFLDLNLPVPGEDPDFDADPPVEIFEAGTGMGALTLCLAKAIHGANPPVPPQLRDALCAAPYERNTLPRKLANSDEAPEYNTSPHALDFAGQPELAALHEKHTAGRRAILHTLDINPTSSRMAHSLVRHFRRAMYLLDVDFHVRTIRSYLSSRLSRNGGQPFLSHVILDLPASQEHADVAVEALRPGGKLVVFFPSITQILNFVVWAKDEAQPLILDRVVELQTSTSGGDGMFRDGTGGRNWEVKVVNIRKAVQEGETGAAAQAHVCRPKVGTLVVGGGFVAVFGRIQRQGGPVVEPAEETMATTESASGFVSDTEMCSDEDASARPS
ncbi:tRNA (Adenine-N(1)-)-methyltransferase [Colletotrichum higginsianum IMI 349063]|uniref:tRNA (adenine(58)-N(1))-methyltransferase catalytic subunit TRM61 n=2 Tax=Colletotrichum higginsianum TaxID=80884 RepID=A0A1B7XVY1_COLHI|nr:tRNA (Adenine-N(1)-)-methyltransferase [Colletotrichum higginsianum IMI 349063]OBR03904.1 tRNA (Adenine-N(1)-)-methyltransferase [Colletotrichum higginsianum IMI 349063]